MTIRIGIDGGGSHTAAVTKGATGALVRWMGKPGAVRKDAPGEAVSRWIEAVGGVLHGAGLPSDSACVVVVGAAGTGRTDVRTRVEDLMAAALPAGSMVRVVTDGLIALEAVFPDGRPGIAMMAGTGSIVYARTPEGDLHRVGGHGWRMGDEGSGYALGHAALRRVARTVDGRDPPTALATALHRALDLPSVEDLIPWSVQAAPDEVAELARVVCRMADDGDTAAMELVREAARDLTQLMRELRTRLGTAASGEIALGGGVLQKDSPVRSATIHELLELDARLRVLEGVVDPPLGALRLAETM
jgi:N-acetylglucosamine kinase-like BadF-type ATPase